MDAKERRELQVELVKQGFAIQDVGQWPAKATFYKPGGEPMPNLPADPYSMKNYLRRGFTLTPPVKPSNGEGEETPVVLNPTKCAFCDFEAKSEFGLSVHVRKHKRESK